MNEKALLEAAYEAGMAAKKRLEQILATEAAEAAARAAKLTSRVAAFFSRKRPS